eukprot:gene724-897_t
MKGKSKGNITSKWPLFSLPTCLNGTYAIELCYQHRVPQIIELLTQAPPKRSYLDLEWNLSNNNTLDPLLPYLHTTFPSVGHLVLLGAPFGLLILHTLSLTNLKNKAQWWVIIILGLLQIIGCMYLLGITYQGSHLQHTFTWFQISKNAVFKLGIYCDFLSATMLFLVLTIYSIVQLYAIAYLTHHTKQQQRRYFILSALCVGAACWAILADNLWGIYLGWEIMGILSSILIGFEYDQKYTGQASLQTWLTGRLGALGFLFSMLLLFPAFKDAPLAVFSSPSTLSMPDTPLYLASLGLLLAILSKSAQFPFFNWLSKATVAPTPISSLLHSATVISIGIYLLIRIYPIFPLAYVHSLVIIGYLTACMGACAALYQQETKRILAYSTISQGGYAIAAIGIGTISASMSYWIVHAFAKVILFLCLHFTHVANHKRKANGTPRIAWVKMGWRGALIVLIGFPGLTGFEAKKDILTHTLLWSLQKSANGSYIIAYIVPMMAYIGTGCTLLYLFYLLLASFTNSSMSGFHVQSTPLNNALLSNPNEKLIRISIITLLGLTMILSQLPLSSLIVKGIFQGTFIASPTALENTLSPTLRQSVMVTYTGIFLLAASIAFFRSKKKQLSPPHFFTRLLAQGWYMELLTRKVGHGVCYLGKFFGCIEQRLVTAFASQLANGYVYIATGISYIDRHLLGGLTKNLTIRYVVLAHILSWIDHKLIAGIGDGLSKLFQYGSRIYLFLQRRSIQQHMRWSLMMALLFMGWAGCDEVGRGCLAGPVVAAAVILHKDYVHPLLNDSKKLTETKRRYLDSPLKQAAIAWAIGVATAAEIDQINILKASHLAMHRAITQLCPVPELLLVDGKHFDTYGDIPHVCLVQGDAHFSAIAAASVLAKNYRDAYMRHLAIQYPGYGWMHNVGYPTAAHRKALQILGTSPYHRLSFGGVL